MNRVHAIHSPNEDVCCRFLAMSAGIRTNEDHLEIARALEALPFPHGAVPPSRFPMDPGDVWRLVK